MSDCVACQAPLSLGFPRQEYWSGLPSPSPGDLTDPETEPASPALAGGFLYCWKSLHVYMCIHTNTQEGMTSVFYLPISRAICLIFVLWCVCLLYRRPQFQIGLPTSWSPVCSWQDLCVNRTCTCLLGKTQSPSGSGLRWCDVVAGEFLSESGLPQGGPQELTPLWKDVQMLVLRSWPPLPLLVAVQGFSQATEIKRI